VCCLGPGCRPGFDALDFICRAITPTYSKRRYNTRFFLADGANATGKLAGNGELEDLNWWPLTELPRLAIVDVTEFVLTEALSRWQRKAPIGSEPARLFCYRGDCARWRTIGRGPQTAAGSSSARLDSRRRADSPPAFRQLSEERHGSRRPAIIGRDTADTGHCTTQRIRALDGSWNSSTIRSPASTCC
jgi:hypothetical protein